MITEQTAEAIIEHNHKQGMRGNLMKKSISLFLLWYLVLFLGSSLPYEKELELPRDPVIAIYRELKPERAQVPPRREVPPEFRALFAAAAGSAGIPLGVLESIAFAESGFNPAALSPVRPDGFRDHGMFQFNGKYLGWYKAAYGDFDPMNPDEAAHIAARHLRFLYDYYGHWPTVCLAYNAGMRAVDNDKIPDSSYRYLIKIYE
jgi:hypothetical protein